MSEPARKLSTDATWGPAGDAPALTGFSLTTDEITARFRAAVQEAVSEHLAAGRPVYGADEQERLYALLPDRRKVTITSWKDCPPPPSKPERP